MIGRTLTFVVLLIFLPSIGQALKCSYGGICESRSNFTHHPPKLNTYKNCKESCVYFQCVIDGDNYTKHGYGCPEDFERLCPHASDVLIENGRLVVGENFFHISCNDTDDCAMKGKVDAKITLPILPEIDPFANENCVYDEDEESLLASGEIFFEESYLSKKYLTFYVCFIVIFFGPYVYYEMILGY